jgi:hypothetical protein
LSDYYSSDYYSNEGLCPNGRDDRIDDSSALRKALEDGSGIVQIEPGFYRFNGICVPENVTLQGSGWATVIRSTGSTSTFFKEDVYRWTIRNMTLNGETKG